MKKQLYIIVLIMGVVFIVSAFYEKYFVPEYFKKLTIQDMYTAMEMLFGITFIILCGIIKLLQEKRNPKG